MNRTENLVRKNIRELTPYSSARDEYPGRKGIFLDANENPYGKLNRYPDPHHRKLRLEVSRIKGIPTENIFLGNGSDEAIELIYRIFCNPRTDKALSFTPTYAMYGVSAAVNDVEMISVPLDKDFGLNHAAIEPFLDDEFLKLIFICSPNNPTSNSFDRETIIRIIENFRGIVVIDEAYIDFSDHPSFIQLTCRYSNLIVLQTFSKAWGAAGIRVGMAFADPLIINYLYRVKPPYNLSTLSQKAALKRLENPGKYRKQADRIKLERKRLSGKIKELGITDTVFPSDANFLLVKVTNADLIYKILSEKNIIVRNRSSVIENCLRITMGTKKENDRLLKEMKKIRI